MLGAVAGSFANVVIHRIPRGTSIVRPPSACPACGRRITALENVPIVSYVGLRGHCRGCGERISRRYPLVELGLAALWALTLVRTGLRPELAAHLVFVTTLVILSLIDLETRRLPNKVMGPAFLLGLALLAGAAIATGRPALLQDAMIGALAYGVPMLALAIAVPSGMGMGDAKFAGYIGLHLGSMGILHVAVGAFLGFFLGAFAGVSMMVMGKKDRKETIPFGPAMAAGAVAALWWSEPILNFWLG